jgi:prepilin-type N-terminal cleavage/methylation domain-containing protein
VLQRQHQIERAFTLLEMLVALALMAVIAGSLYASLRIGFDTRDSAERAIAAARAADLQIEPLRRDFETALPPTGILAGPFLAEDGKADSGNDSDTLSFYSCANSEYGTADTNTEHGCDIRKVELEMTNVEGESNPALVRRITTNLLAVVATTPPDEVICHNVLGFNLRYFDGTSWLDAWDSTALNNVLPLAVEITLTLAPTKEELARNPAAAPRTVTRVIEMPCGQKASDAGGTTGSPAM